MACIRHEARAQLGTPQQPNLLLETSEEGPQAWLVTHQWHRLHALHPEDPILRWWMAFNAMVTMGHEWKTR
jgi:hypothetical protein